MRDLTQGNPLKLILIFTLPLFIGNLFQQLYNFSDVLIVGQTLGVKPLAAVGSTSSLNFLIIGFANGLTAGFAIVSAQRWGARDLPGVRKSFATSIVFSILVTIVLTALSLIFLNPVMHMMSIPANIYGNAKTFISIIFAGIFSFVLFNMLSNELRALGDSRTPLFFLIIGTVLNVILELLFILVFHWGVAGSGLATVSSQLVASLLCIVYIIKRVPVLHVEWSDFKAVPAEFANHARYGLPMAFQTSIIAVGSLFLQSALNSLGTDAVAATTFASKIDQLATLPMMSFGITMATYTAQNLGAAQFERIIKGVKQALMASVSFSILVGALIILYGQKMVMLFIGNQDAHALVLSQTYFNIVGFSYWILAILFIVRYTLQGLGQSLMPTLAGVAELCMRSFAAFILVHYFQYAGACFASPLAWLGSTLVLITSYVTAMHTLHNMQRMQEQVTGNNDPQFTESFIRRVEQTFKVTVNKATLARLKNRPVEPEDEGIEQV